MLAPRYGCSRSSRSSLRPFRRRWRKTDPATPESIRRRCQRPQGRRRRGPRRTGRPDLGLVRLRFARRNAGQNRARPRARAHDVPRNAGDFGRRSRRHRRSSRRADERRNDLRLHAILFRDAGRQSRRRALHRGRSDAARRAARCRLGGRTQRRAQRTRRRCQLAVLQSAVARARGSVPGSAGRAHAAGQPHKTSPTRPSPISRATISNGTRPTTRRWWSRATFRIKRSSPRRNATSARFRARRCRRRRPATRLRRRGRRSRRSFRFPSKSSTSPTRFPATSRPANPPSARSPRCSKTSVRPSTKALVQTQHRAGHRELTPIRSCAADCSTSSSFSTPGITRHRGAGGLSDNRSTSRSNTGFSPDLVTAAKRLTIAERLYSADSIDGIGDLAGYTYGIVGEKISGEDRPARRADRRRSARRRANVHEPARRSSAIYAQRKSAARATRTRATPPPATTSPSAFRAARSSNPPGSPRPYARRRRRAARFRRSTFTLSNGLRVIVQQKDRPADVRAARQHRVVAGIPAARAGRASRGWRRRLPTTEATSIRSRSGAKRPTRWARSSTPVRRFSAQGEARDFEQVVDIIADGEAHPTFAEPWFGIERSQLANSLQSEIKHLRRDDRSGLRPAAARQRRSVAAQSDRRKRRAASPATISCAMPAATGARISRRSPSSATSRRSACAPRWKRRSVVASHGIQARSAPHGDAARQPRATTTSGPPPTKSTFGSGSRQSRGRVPITTRFWYSTKSSAAAARSNRASGRSCARSADSSTASAVRSTPTPTAAIFGSS